MGSGNHLVCCNFINYHGWGSIGNYYKNANRNRAKNKWNQKNLSTVKKRKVLGEKMQNCTTIKVLAFSAFGFTHLNRTVLTNHVARGGRLELLLAKEKSAIATDASLMERRGHNAITNSITETIELLQAIEQDAKTKANELGRACGDVEVQQYNTEISNQLVF